MGGERFGSRTRSVALGLLLAWPGWSSCTGLYQRALPDRVATYARADATPGAVEVGFAERDITPAEMPYLGGFDPNRVATAIASPLAVRAMVLRRGQTKLAIVGIDNLGVMRDDVDWIKTGVAGFENGSVFLCSSHTHAGPDLIGMWGFYYLSTGRADAVLTQMRRAVAEAVREAEQRAVPAKLSLGRARLPREGFVRNSNVGGVFDPRFVVLHAVDAETEQPLGSLLHMACHPEVLRRGNTRLASDFVGPLCDRWRAAGNGQAVFVNGALGAMISPHPSGDDGMVAMVDKLSEVAAAALSAAEPLEADVLEVRRSDLFMPLTSPGFLAGKLTLVIERSSHEGLLKTGVGYLRIGAFEVACVPGEMEPALAEQIRRDCGKPDLVLFGLCDDEIGYLMRVADARDPLYDYERVMSPEVRAGEKVRAALVRPSAASYGR